MSVAQPTSCPRACSGDMYAGEPTSAPVAVMVSMPVTWATPKSVITTRLPVAGPEHRGHRTVAQHVAQQVPPQGGAGAGHPRPRALGWKAVAGRAGLVPRRHRHFALAPAWASASFSLITGESGSKVLAK